MEIVAFAKRFFAGTLLSRVSGLCREMAIAFCFGSSPEIAAFMVAYRLANLFRRLLGEGNLQAGFIPLFEENRGEDPQKGARFFQDTMASLTLLSLGGVVVLELFLGGALFFVGPSWEEVVRLAMWMTPGLVFITLSSLNAAFLQAHGKFFLSGASPLFFNGVWIAFAFFSASFPFSLAMRYLSCGIVLAFFVQWGATFFQVRRISFFPPFWRFSSFFSFRKSKLLKPLSLGVLGVGAVQINSAFDALFARFADLSGPAYLWYALRVQQLPLSLIALTLSGALLPSLSRAAQSDNPLAYRNLLEKTLELSLAIIVPAVFALIVLGPLGLSILYGRGHFTQEGLLETLYCLWGYAPGLLFSSQTILLANGLYAKKSYAFPAKAAAGSVVLNILINALMVFVLKWGAFSVAIGTSLAALCNWAFLLRFFQKEMGISWGKSLPKLCLAGIIASIGTVAVGSFGFLMEDSFGIRVFWLGAKSLLFGGLFFGASYALKVEWLRNTFSK